MQFVLTQILFAVSYLLVGGTVALAIPAAMDIAPMPARWAGGLIVLVAALTHFLLVQRSRRRTLEAEIVALHGDHTDMRREIDHLKGEIDELRDHAQEQVERTNEHLMSEVKVLQTLLAQVVTKSGRTYRSTEAAISAARVANAPDRGELDEAQVLDIMHNALEANRVDLYLQPIVGLPARKVQFYETYSRVRDSSGRIIYPRQYLHLAEREGLVSTLDNILLYRCVQIIRQLRRRRPDRWFFVNISSTTLSDDQFFDQFIDFMGHNPDLVEHIVFEIAQSDITGVDELIDTRLEALTTLGFQLSLDHVTDLDLDLRDLSGRGFRFVKIDAGIFFGQEGPLHKDDYKEAMKRHDLELIIEKIEEESTLVELLDYHIDFGQGYLFGEPRRGDPEDVDDFE